MADTDIVIRGAREHNLRDVNLRLPRNKLICMTGVSGSGKSSLAFDTLYAEGQRRYVESLSSYARQFLGQMPKPEVDSVSGLAPSISIQQKTSGRNPRSTVGTITEIYDYLRVLFARVGTASCHRCGRPITAQSTEQIIQHILGLPAGTRYQILAPLVQQQKGEYRDLFEDLLKQGFLRARVDGRVVQLTEDLQLDRQMRHNIEVVVDRLSAGKTNRTRLAEAVESALKLTGGTLIVSEESTKSEKSKDDEAPPATTDRLYSSHFACTHCGISYEQPSPQLFSFNSPLGMCPDCNGLGKRHEFLLDRLITSERKSISRGAIELLGSLRSVGRWRRHLIEGVAASIERDLDMQDGSFLKTPWADLPEAAREQFLYGTGDRHITFSWRHRGGTWKHGGTWDGYIPSLLDDYHKARNPMRRRQLEKYMEFAVCSACEGARLNDQARSVRLTTANRQFESAGGTALQKGRSRSSATNGDGEAHQSLSLPEVCGLSILEAAEFFAELDLDETGQLIAEEVLKEIRGRLGFLLRCGLDYLALDRTAPTLSGGETQRIRLAGQIGCGLVGVVYILDEPSIGLHPRDNTMLLESLRDLRDQGNTVIVVEHDEETMRAADHLVDFGPGPGIRGGEVVAEGSLKVIQKESRSVTGQYLSGRQTIPIPEQRRKPTKKALKVVGARHNNLRDVDARFPLGMFVCVTGVSGSGKSSLVNDILWQVLNRDVNQGNGKPGTHKRVNGLHHLDKAIDIDQSPIGRTPRSNPATYVKLFDLIRQLYTQLPESRVRGYKPGRFSFNVSDGRCEACEGYGSNKLEMDFLADIWVTCPVCGGQRFNHETLEVKYKHKSIAEVLEMDVQEALTHFENHPKINRLLQTLHDVGLDYLKLGQASPTLSGGEAQRIKLARELGKRSTGSTIYLLDEPTTGLHFADIHKLLEVLHGFVDAGNTVLVVEHNLDVVKTADWVIDLGPEGGAGGGTIIAEGPPEEIARCAESHTGAALRELFTSLGRDIEIPEIAAPPRQSFQTLNGNGHADHSANGNGKPERESTRTDQLVVRGAAQHNLKAVDVIIPRERMNVFCGPSGSGKSSLAMDTLYAEGQRRYVESLSAYARQFLGQMPKPRVDHIHGLSPAIAIEQKSTGTTPRSTVGTVTEIYDYLRILYARIGQRFCPDCQLPIETQTTDEVIARILEIEEGTRLLLLAPQEIRVGQQYDSLWDRLRAGGFLRVRIDGMTYRLDDVPEIDRRRRHQVEVVVDRITVRAADRSRIADSVETALELGHGVIAIARSEPDVEEQDWPIERYSLDLTCQQCGQSFEELTPHSFSFNSWLGWCEACEGLGTEQGTNIEALISDPQQSIGNAAIAAWPDPSTQPLFAIMLDVMAGEMKIPLDVPFSQLEPLQRRAILYGTGEQWFDVPAGEELTAALGHGSANAGAKKKRKKKSQTANDSTAPPVFRFQYKGLYPAIEEASRVSYVYRQQLHGMVGEVPCSVCDGSRLRRDAAAVRLAGKTLQQLCELPLEDALQFLKSIRLPAGRKRIAADLLDEAGSRLSFLVDVGLEYLTLSRTLPTLSGGEMQRIRLAGQIGRALTGVLYVLDEPTIGLHPRDNARLIRALHRLRDLGNTLVLVEHDREVLESADRLYDFGPGAGQFGGTVTGQGTPKQLGRRTKSLTGQFLSDKRQIAIPAHRRMNDRSAAEESGGDRSCDEAQRPPGGGWLELIGARHHNLRDVTLRVPLGVMTCVTGVSGSGKSSLIEDTLARALHRQLHRAGDAPAPHRELRGLELVNKVITVDQQPLGSTPASNPATYTGVFDHIRELFARLPEAKVRGFRPARFSFNRAGGRCDDCEGNGQKCIEMHFLPDVWVECETCHGKRYNQETLAVKYRGKSIADVLEMPIGEAAELFENIPKIRRYLATLVAIGLDYLTLGQPAPTLSGGEAQRVKLAAELARPNTGRTLYILDEPTTGLHFDDIDKLLKVLGSLVELGNSVVVIEHNLDVIKTADWIIDIGPEAGQGGGWIVAEGTPEDIVQHYEQYTAQESASAGNGKATKKKSRSRKKTAGNTATIVAEQVRSGRLLRSHTGEMLAPVLKEGQRADREVFDARAVAKKQEGDVDLKKIGRNAKMPWQTDGRRWHCVDRVGHNGQPCRWEGAALAYVVDQLESESRIAAPNWNHRSVVEIKSASKAGDWFLHAMTGDEWLLTLKFRVPKRTFQEDDLSRRLGLKPIDDLDELAVYGRGERVRVRNIKGPMQEVCITVHWLREIETPEFDRFLREATEAFLSAVDAAPQDPRELMPWKVLGRKWHISRKGFPSGKRVKWEAAALDALFDLLLEVAPSADVEWGGKQKVRFSGGELGDRPVDLFTKRRGGIDVQIDVPAGTIALGRIADFGTDREIKPGNSGRETVKIRFVSLDGQLEDLRTFLQETIAR